MPTLQRLNELLDPAQAGPCVSIYLPTHRQHPDNKQDPILFRNLVKQAEGSLIAQHSKGDVAQMLAPFYALAADANFWNHTTDGLAIFGGNDFFRVMHLQRPTAPLAIVADSFHIKPILRVLQSADRFQVLSVNRQSIRLFEGNRDKLDEVKLAADVPTSASDVIGDDLPEPTSRMRTVGASPAGGGNRATGDVRYTHGAKEEVIDPQTERFFRAVDRSISTYHSKPSGLPLVLVALPENAAMFRAVSHNDQLLEEGIQVDPDSLSIDELRSRSWKAIEPIYIGRLAGFIDEFNAARNAQQASADLSDVAAAAIAGRVRVLLLEAGRQLPGRIDPKTGALHSEGAPGTDDMLDDLAEQALRTGAEVIMVPAERMPTTSGLAAIYRF
ncbi:MAG: hypothetical protein ITG07_08565 [Candidimonas sp.]|nr:hypothetical protein [Candidimonas sp.]